MAGRRWWPRCGAAGVLQAAEIFEAAATAADLKGASVGRSLPRKKVIKPFLDCLFSIELRTQREREIELLAKEDTNDLALTLQASRSPGKDDAWWVVLAHWQL